MRFLTVAERELREAARRPGTYRTRWLTALAFFGLLLWLMWSFNVFHNKGAAARIFPPYSILTFFYCLILGAMTTADCLSSERREGTLGLLYLTNLNSAEIVAGKFLSSALSSIYGLVAIFPMLALPLLMGGVTFSQFWRTILALLATIFISIAAGIGTSVFCRRQFTAIGAAMGVALLFGVGGTVVGTFFSSLRIRGVWVEVVSMFSPYYALHGARAGWRLSRYDYWLSLAAVTALGLVWLLFVTWRLSRSWRDRPKGPSLVSRFGVFERWRRIGSAGRTDMRRRLLGINPYYWLGGRKLLSSPIFMLLALLIVMLTAYGTVPFFIALVHGSGPKLTGPAPPVFGTMFAWMWTGLAVHLLVMYYAAMISSQQLAEDKQAGALELVLSTPTDERIITRGLWMAYGRRMLFPAIVAVMVHCFFIWQLMTMALLEPPGRSSVITASPWQLFFAGLLDLRIGGLPVDWEIAMMARATFLLLVLAVVVWLTLGWLGRWLGLKMKHPGFAPIVALARVAVPPVVLFTFACILADRLNLDRMPERHFVPLMMWVGAAIGFGNCLIISVLAARNLRHEFRTIAMSRYQPPVKRRWLPRWRTIRRLVVAMIAFAVVIVAAVMSFYGYQNWKSRRAWASFQKELQRKGQNLSVALLPSPERVPDVQNFYLSAPFQSLLSGTNAELAKILRRLETYDAANNSYGNTTLFTWVRQGQAPFDQYLRTISSKASVSATSRAEYAAMTLAALKTSSSSDEFRPLMEAARLPFFQMNTGKKPAGERDILLSLERLHALLQLRASALLELDRISEAHENALAAIHLARLARQLTDDRATFRAQLLSTRSLQPIWDGIALHRWNDAQLAEFQKQLAGFKHLIDFTNAVHQRVLRQIDEWQRIPAGANRASRRSGDQWKWEPRNWSYDRCIQLYVAGQHAIQKVNVATNYVLMEDDWMELDGLQLDDSLQQMIQQFSWWGPHPTLVGFAQNAVNQAIIACAIERYRLAQGRLPPTLDELVPAYLDRVPNDIMRGRPMAYQASSTTNLILRSAGPNGQDDRKTPMSSDDWLWSYPTNTPALKKGKK